MVGRQAAEQKEPNRKGSLDSKYQNAEEQTERNVRIVRRQMSERREQIERGGQKAHARTKGADRKGFSQANANVKGADQ